LVRGHWSVQGHGSQLGTPQATPSEKVVVGRSSGDDAAKKQAHSAHRTGRVKVRGLLEDLPGTDGPVEVYVYVQSDWELIYKNPDVHVKCVVPSCDTRLMAKRMSKSGLRFFAVRSGGCSHDLTQIPVDRGEEAQDPSTLVGGGGVMIRTCGWSSAG